MIFIMAPGRISGIAFKDAGNLRVDHRKTVLFPSETVEINRVGRAIDIGAERLENVAGGVELAGVNEHTVGPADGGIHVGNVEFEHGTFVKDGAEAVAVLNSREVDDGADARIESE